MNYSGEYIDGDLKKRRAVITQEDSVEALKNDYMEVVRRYNPRYVTIWRIQAMGGEALHLKVNVRAPTHYLESIFDSSPKECNSMTVDIVCYPGYPLKAVQAFYASNHYLASPNVFKSGAACIDRWIPFTSSLTSVVEKLVRDMIHDPSVTRYDSTANGRLKQWHMDGVRAGKFPTIQPKLLYAPENANLPPRKTLNNTSIEPPSLPPRH